MPCPGGSGDFAGGCHVGVLVSAVGGAGGFVSVVTERLAGGEAGLVLEIVIKNVLCKNLHRQ